MLEPKSKRAYQPSASFYARLPTTPTTTTARAWSSTSLCLPRPDWLACSTYESPTPRGSSARKCRWPLCRCSWSCAGQCRSCPSAARQGWARRPCWTAPPLRAPPSPSWWLPSRCLLPRTRHRRCGRACRAGWRPCSSRGKRANCRRVGVRRLSVHHPSRIGRVLVAEIQNSVNGPIIFDPLDFGTIPLIFVSASEEVEEKKSKLIFFFLFLLRDSLKVVSCLGNLHSLASPSADFGSFSRCSIVMIKTTSKQNIWLFETKTRPSIFKPGPRPRACGTINRGIML